MYAADFTGRGGGDRSTDIVLTQTIAGTEFPYYGLLPLGKSLYQLGIRFPDHD